MHKRLARVTMTNEEMLETIDVIGNTLNSNVIPSIIELEKEVKDRKELCDNVAFSKLNLKNDGELFKRLLGVIEKYNKILPVLKTKVSEELSDTIVVGSSNLNNRIAVSLITEGIFLSKEVPFILTNVINKFYVKSGSELDTKIHTALTRKMILLIQILPELEKADLEAVVNAIGNVPAIKTIREEKTSDIPADIVLGFFKTNFSIKDFYTQTFLKRVLGYFNFKKEHKHHANITKNFMGNPIYHLRLFLVDLRTMRLESLKEEKTLLELRILELKNGDPDGKLKSQISYYENKLNKLDMKIKRLADTDKG